MVTKLNSLGRFLVFMVCLLAGVSAMAQGRQVTGQILSGDDSQPLPGASVVIKGTANGTVTDLDGNFTISVPGDNSVLIVSYVGYKSQEISAGKETSFKITLESATLDEVVVTGYTIDNKRQTTGSVSTVKAKDLKAIPSGNVEQQLQGRVPGVTVITNGQPGTTSIIRVRGFGSIGGNEPLYVVDGVPVGSTDFLNPDDIESTTVLKDAAAASIYGARAASGVIVFTTKRGSKKAKALEVSYDGLYGVTNPGKGQEMLNPTDFANWTWNAIKNTATQEGKTPVFNHPQFGSGSTPVIPDYINVGGRSGVVGSVDLAAEKLKYNVNPAAGGIYQVVKANKSGTDWYDAITRNAPISRHSLGFSGGTETSRFYVGLGLQDQAGILVYNNFKRYSARINTEFELTKKLRIGENLQFTYRQVLGQGGGNGGRGVAGDENDILQAFRMPSIIPVYDEFGGYAGTAAKGFNNPRNPVASRDGQANDRNFNANGFGNIYAEYDVIPGLTLRSSYGGQYNNYYYKFYSRLQYENSENNASFGFGEGSGFNYGWVFTNTAAYKNKFGVHSIDAIAGIESLNTGYGRSIDGNGINPFATDKDYVTLSTVSSAGKNVNSGLNNGVTFYSTFAKVNYGFNDKYYVTGVIRRDGSSRFGANNRYGVFPAFSASWRVTAEDFMKGITFVNDLKIRGGWGQMGNSNNVNPFNQYSLFASGVGTSAYDINGANTSIVSGFYKSRIGNPDAKWEAATTSDLGIDATFLGGKLDLVIDFWKKTTDGLLYQVPLPAVNGSSAAPPAVNIASMLNKGIDFALTNKGKVVGDWKYEATLNGAFLHNEITSLAPTVPYFDGSGFRGVTPVRNLPGYSLSTFFGYKVLGYFKDAAEVSGAAKQDGAAPGRFRYEDNNGTDANGKLTGKPDGKIDAADRTVIGSPVPKFTGGLYLSFQYKSFEVNTYLYSSIGNKIYNFSKWYTDFYPSFTGAAISARVKNSWTPTNLNAEAPIFEGASNFSTNSASNSWYVEDGSYLRMQYIGFGYSLPTELLKKISVKRAKLTASVNNIFTVTKYKGLDPGVGGSVDTNFGIDVGNYPVTRSFMFGVSIGF